MTCRCSVQRLYAGCNTFSLMAQGVQEDTKTSMKAEELVEILKGEGDRKEKDVAQSGVISDEVGELYFGRAVMSPFYGQSGMIMCISKSGFAKTLLTLPVTHCRCWRSSWTGVTSRSTPRPHTPM